MVVHEQCLPAGIKLIDFLINDFNNQWQVETNHGTFAGIGLPGCSPLRRLIFSLKPSQTNANDFSVIHLKAKLLRIQLKKFNE